MRAGGMPAGLAVVALVLAGCGGGGGSSSGATPPPSMARLELVAVGDALLPSGSLQTRLLELRNTGTAAACDVQIKVKLDAAALQLPLSCEGAAAKTCQINATGDAINLGDLPIGGVVQIRQQLRVKSGVSGVVVNDWSYGSSGGATSSLRQSLQAYAADLSVTVRQSSSDSDPVLTYEVTLSNAGPDDAREVVWDQLAAPGMALIDAACSASAGAACPTTVGEHLSIARMPKQAELKLVLRYRPAESLFASIKAFAYLGSEVRSAADPLASNDRQILRQPQALSRDGNFFAVGMEGDHYRLRFSAYGAGGFRMSGNGLDLGATPRMTVLGSYGLAATATADVDVAAAESIQNLTSLMLGATKLARGRQFFVASQEVVTSLAELEGLNFVMLSSRADQTGRPVDALVQTARIQDGSLEICGDAEAMPLARCPAAQVERYQVSVVGSELELVSARESFRVVAARTPSGPVLIHSQRNSDDGSVRFGLGVPTGKYFSGSDRGDVAQTTFGNAQGLADPSSLSVYYGRSPDSVELSTATTAAFLLRHAGYSLCHFSAKLSPTSTEGLFLGRIEANLESGDPCYSGPVYFIGVENLAVVLGAKGGPLMGRWLITTR